jgi:xanthine dehydrogenase accessory factor
MRQITIAIRGAGEMATAIASRLAASHFGRIVMSEIPLPVAVRRKVAFSEAVYSGEMVVEGVRAELVRALADLPPVWDRKAIGILVDGEGGFIAQLVPDVLIDATMVKRRKGSLKGQGSRGTLVIGVGPGFRAPDEVDAVIESNRGHNLGRVIYEGEAEPFSGVPGVVAGAGAERVLRAPHAGMVRPVRSIGEAVKRGDVILYVDETPVYAGIDGVLRGLIRPIEVPEHEKVGDVDPRGDKAHCATISDKARAIAGGVLEAVMHRFHGE